MAKKLRRFTRGQLIGGALARWGYLDTPYTEDDGPIALVANQAQAIQGGAEGRNYHTALPTPKNRLKRAKSHGNAHINSTSAAEE